MSWNILIHILQDGSTIKTAAKLNESLALEVKIKKTELGLLTFYPDSFGKH